MHVEKNTIVETDGHFTDIQKRAHRVQQLRETANIIANDLSRVADNVYGPEPESDSVIGSASTEAGGFAQLDLSLDQLAASMEQLAYQAGRLHNL